VAPKVTGLAREKVRPGAEIIEVSLHEVGGRSIEDRRGGRSLMLGGKFGSLGVAPGLRSSGAHRQAAARGASVEHPTCAQKRRSFPSEAKTTCNRIKVVCGVGQMNSCGLAAG